MGVGTVAAAPGVVEEDIRGLFVRVEAEVLDQDLSSFEVLIRYTNTRYQATCFRCLWTETDTEHVSRT